MVPAIAVLVVTGFALGLVIGLVVKLFGAEADPKLEAVEGLLPGANCGGCGYAGCADFARALMDGGADPAACPSNAPEALKQICAILGIAAGERAAKVAVVRCGGSRDVAKEAAGYNGITDCKAAVQVAGGTKLCRYGCLGLATCARACPFGAIEMTAGGIAVVHPRLCTGCGKCVASCPRGLIALVPAATPVHVYCNSPEKGAAKRAACSVSCIGCRKCVKAAGDGQMAMEGFLARVNADDPPGPDVCEVCPTGCLKPALETEPAVVAAGHGNEGSNA
jgi:electron transport complex protein RnfB